MTGHDLDTRLRADCSRCVGLCCVAPAFVRSSDFAIDKPAGQACPHLRQDFRCGIHDQLRARGFPGCAAFDCFGAGQQVTQVTFGGRDWHTHPELARQMFDAFGVMRQLHELVPPRGPGPHRGVGPYASDPPAAASLPDELGAAFDRTEALTHLGPAALLATDAAALRRDTGELLGRASALVRTTVPAAPRARARTTATARRRPRAGRRDLAGADLRGADLSGADLTGSLFLLQSQVDAARGDVTTRLPPALQQPPHWV